LTGFQFSSTILSRSQQASLRPRLQTLHPPTMSVSACIFCNVCFLGVALRPSWVCRPSFHSLRASVDLALSLPGRGHS
jgi:hypothetical protein